MNEVQPWVQLQWLLWSNSRTVVTSHARIAYTFNPGLRGQSIQTVELKMSLQSPFLHEEGLGSLPLFPCWYTAPKQRLINFSQDSSTKNSANKHLITTSYLNWDMWSVMQEFSATRDYQHLGRRLQPHTQSHRQPFPCKFILSPASVVYYLWQFAAIPGQSLCDYWLSFQELQETKVKLTIPY